MNTDILQVSVATHLRCDGIYAFTTRHCLQRRYVFGPSIRRVHSFVQTALVTMIYHEQLEQS